MQYIYISSINLNRDGLLPRTPKRAGLAAGSLRALLDGKAEQDAAAAATSHLDSAAEERADLMPVLGGGDPAADVGELVIGLDMLGFHDSNALSARLLADGELAEGLLWIIFFKHFFLIFLAFSISSEFQGCVRVILHLPIQGRVVSGAVNRMIKVARVFGDDRMLIAADAVDGKNGVTWCYSVQCTVYNATLVNYYT